MRFTGIYLNQKSEKSPFEVRCNHRCAEILIIMKSNFFKTLLRKTSLKYKNNDNFKKLKKEDSKRSIF